MTSELTIQEIEDMNYDMAEQFELDNPDWQKIAELVTLYVYTDGLGNFLLLNALTGKSFEISENQAAVLKNRFEDNWISEFHG